MQMQKAVMPVRVHHHQLRMQSLLIVMVNKLGNQEERLTVSAPSGKLNAVFDYFDSDVPEREWFMFDLVDTNEGEEVDASIHRSEHLNR